MESSISVIIPIYNVEKYIHSGIQNMLQQSYDKLEIILVDDGSTDDSGVLCDSLIKLDNRIRVCHKKNGGAGSARNIGLNIAKGKYVFFFDIDDQADRDLIRMNAEIMEKMNLDFCVFGFDVCDSDDKIIDTIIFKDHLIEDNSELKKSYVDELLLVKHGNGFVWNKFYSREFLQKNHIEFENQPIQQDEVFNLKVYPVAERVYITSAIYYHYKIYNKDNASYRYRDRIEEIYEDVYKHFLMLYNQWNLDDDRFLDFVNKRFARSVFNAVTENYCHQKCPLSLCEKANRIQMALSRDSYIQATKNKQYYWGTKNIVNDLLNRAINNKRPYVIVLIVQFKRIIAELRKKKK